MNHERNRESNFIIKCMLSLSEKYHDSIYV